MISGSYGLSINGGIESAALHRLRETKVLSDNELFLGFRNIWSPKEIREMSRSLLRREIVTMPFSHLEKPKNMLCTGGNGSGKSYHLGFGVCTDQIIRYFRNFLMCCL